MLNAPKATVVRDGKRSLIDAEELVVDDIVIFKAGAQVCADAQVCAGEVQVNESLLTGESDEITKHAGDQLMSGSFIMQDLIKSVKILIFQSLHWKQKKCRMVSSQR